MDTSNATTIADLTALTPENYRSELTELTNHRRPLPARKAGKSAHLTRLTYRGRQVLIPGKRKAARHPWAARLEAARTGGFVVDQTHPGSDKVVGSCYGCGHRFGFVIGDQVGQDVFEAEVKRHERSPLDGLRGCERGVTL
jgi:hypothetical protein